MFVPHLDDGIEGDTTPVALNAYGQVLVNGADEALLWSSATGLYGLGAGTEGRDLDDLGHVVGAMPGGGGTRHAFVTGAQPLRCDGPEDDGDHGGGGGDGHADLFGLSGHKRDQFRNRKGAARSGPD